MIEERAPFYLISVAALIFVGMMLAVQPYSVTSTWHVYDQPARLFLRAAAQGDSLTLLRRTSTSDAAGWALTAARAHPDSIAVWASEAKAWTGTRRGDTSVVFLSARSSQCNLVLRFVGPEKGARVEHASSDCLGPH
jgi:hypothetical protein